MERMEELNENERKTEEEMQELLVTRASESGSTIDSKKTQLLFHSNFAALQFSQVATIAGYFLRSKNR